MQAKRKNTSILGYIAFGAALLGSAAQAEVGVESAVLGNYTITLHLHPFLTADDLSILRYVLTSEDGLALFVPQGAEGFAAMAASPEDGFMKGAEPATSVMALAGLPDAQTAAKDAIAGCQAATVAPSACVVVLDIAPK
jgi:hypothetical protein